MSDYNDNGAFGDASLANEQDHQIQHGRMPAAPSSGGYQQLHTEVDAFGEATKHRDPGVQEDAFGEAMADGYSFTPEDMKIFDSVKSELSQHGMTPEMSGHLMNWYGGFAQEEAVQQEANDDQAQTVALNALGTAWGTDYQRNLSRLRSAIDRQPFADEFADARLPDGRLLWNSPEISIWLHGLLG